MPRSYTGENITLLRLARQGEITEEMQLVAKKENISAEKVRDEIAAGKMVIPANINHTKLDPIGIGIECTVKINANIGNSPLESDEHCELVKLDACLKYGADAVMDLSTGENINGIRKAMLKASPIPLGTVPLYQAMEIVDKVEDLTTELMLDVITQQAEQGVDFMTIHCGLLKEHLPLTKKRITGIVSRGGSLMAEWMTYWDKQNMLYENFDKVLDIAEKYDVTLSLGDGLRPGCLADASDEAQFAELDALAELVQKCWDRDVQVMVEGPGHVPLNDVERNIKRQQEVCKGAPFYVLGPIVTDVAPGYDHITSAIGAAVAGMHGASFLCYVTPKEHLGLPELEDVRNGIIAYKISAHSADIAKGHPGARDWDDKLARARYAFDWPTQFELSMDPDRAKSMREETLSTSEHGKSSFCTMCGPKFCAMNINQRIAKNEARTAAKNK